MQCPVCKDVTLVMADKQGIEIDYCPQCRGIWLDRGELDKIIERSVPGETRSAGGGSKSSESAPPSRRDYEDSQRHHESRPRKKKSFLSELFDFD